MDIVKREEKDIFSDIAYMILFIIPAAFEELFSTWR